MPSTRSTAWLCTSKIRSIVLGESSRTPSTSPPQATWAASIGVDLSQSYTSSMVTGWSQPETPEACDSRWRTLIPALPRAANSGQYAATGASRSSSPRSTSTSAASEDIVLVVENTQVILFSANGTVLSSSAQLPHTLTTTSP